MNVVSLASIERDSSVTYTGGHPQLVPVTMTYEARQTAQILAILG